MRTSDVLSGGFELAPSPPVGQHFYAKGDSIMSSCLRGSGKRGGNRFLDLVSAKIWCCVGKRENNGGCPLQFLHLPFCIIVEMGNIQRYTH